MFNNFFVLSLLLKRARCNYCHTLELLPESSVVLFIYYFSRPQERGSAHVIASFTYIAVGASEERTNQRSGLLHGCRTAHQRQLQPPRGE